MLVSPTLLTTGLLHRNRRPKIQLLSLSLQFNGHFPRWTWVSRYQNVSILDFIGAKGDGAGEW